MRQKSVVDGMMEGELDLKHSLFVSVYIFSLKWIILKLFLDVRIFWNYENKHWYIFTRWNITTCSMYICQSQLVLRQECVGSSCVVIPFWKHRHQKLLATTHARHYCSTVPFFRYKYLAFAILRQKKTERGFSNKIMVSFFFGG